MKLFEAVVTPVAMYGCATWALTVVMRRELNTAWRRILRMMLGVRRAIDEEWVDYLKRSMHVAEEQATKFGHHDWQ